MALSFLKKVFTFGKDKPAEGEPTATPAADAVMDQAESTFSPEETRAIEAELEPHSRIEDLPVAADPVLPEEMDTAGGPSADAVEAPEFVDEVSEEEVETPAILPAVEEIGDIGLIPLSLLEAEAEAAEIEEIAAPPSVPSGHLPLKGGDQTESEALFARDAPSEGTPEPATGPISPLRGRCRCNRQRGVISPRPQKPQLSPKPRRSRSLTLRGRCPPQPPSSQKASPPAAPSSRHRRRQNKNSPGSSACARGFRAHPRS